VVNDLSELKSLSPCIKRSVVLGEGRTPLINFHGNLYLKLENLNPTGSFKDRGAALAISWVKNVGKFKTVIEDSSGNAGIAVSAYSAGAGLKARIYVPSTIPEGKYLMLRVFGAEVIKAGTRNDAHRKATSDREGLYVGHVINPLFIEGMKDIALEIVKDLRSVPDTILAPVASGTLILALWKGFNELRELGLIDRIPRLISVQACGYSTLKDMVKTYYIECDHPSELADALRLTIVPRINQIANAVKGSSGFNMVVGDKALVKALKELWVRGITAEPSSAATYAAYRYAMKEGIDLGNLVVAIITGSGLKYVKDIGRLIAT